MVVLALVALLRMKVPLEVLATPTARLPLAVTVEPDSDKTEELVTVVGPVNNTIFPATPPLPLTEPPTPLQLPAVVQMK